MIDRIFKTFKNLSDRNKRRTARRQPLTSGDGHNTDLPDPASGRAVEWADFLDLIEQLLKRNRPGDSRTEQQREVYRRAALGYSQADCAKLVGVNPSTVSRWFRDMRYALAGVTANPRDVPPLEGGGAET